MNEISVQTTGLLARAELRPLRQPTSAQEAEDLRVHLQQLAAAAAADAHGVINPTHVMVKEGRIIGYLSIGGLPVVQCWFDSKNPHATDSLKMIEHGETVCRTQGIREYAVACAETSPFSKHMERLGYTKLGTTTLWRKEL